jgi:hypothetical protein
VKTRHGFLQLLPTLSVSVTRKQILEQSVKPALSLCQICRLCRQQVAAELQAQESLILIEKFALCPNCWQPVRPDIACTLAYRNRWRTRVRAICKKNGWGW